MRPWSRTRMMSASLTVSKVWEMTSFAASDMRRRSWIEHVMARLRIQARGRSVENEYRRCLIMARAMATRWRWPPDSRLPAGRRARQPSGISITKSWASSLGRRDHPQPRSPWASRSRCSRGWSRRSTASPASAGHNCRAGRQLQVSKVRTINAYVARSGVVEASISRAMLGLAGAAVAHQRHPFPRPDAERDIG